MSSRDRTGVLLAGLLCFGLSAFLAARLPPLFGADERPHFAYTVTLLDGRLPKLTEPSPFTDDFPIIERSLDRPGPAGAAQQAIYVANHPPLAYALTAPAVWAAGELGGDALPTLAFRLMNALSMAVGVVLTGLLAAELFPRREGVATAAALLTAVVPVLIGVAAYAHNDGPAFAFTTACLLLGARMMRRGLTASRLAVASLVAAAALSTRASAAVAVAAIGACVAVAACRRWGTRVAALARAAGAGLVVGASAFAAAGWFYLRNRELYGTFTADEYLLEHFGRVPNGTLLDVLTTGEFHSRMWTGLYGRVHGRLSPWHPGIIVAGLLVVMAVGLAVAAVRRWRARSSGAPSPVDASVDRRVDEGGGATADGIGLAGWLIVLGFCVGVVAATASFVADGGGPHSRYLLSVVPVVSAVVARSLFEAPWPRLALAVVAGVQLANVVAQIAQFPDLIVNPRFPRPFTTASAGGGAQAAAATVAVLAGIGLVAVLVEGGWASRHRPSHLASSADAVARTFIIDAPGAAGDSRRTYWVPTASDGDRSGGSGHRVDGGGGTPVDVPAAEHDTPHRDQR